MKSKKKILCVLALVLAACMPMFAQTETSPKLEMRSTWLTTVWRLDWPSTYSQGEESQIQAQKDQMIKILDSLAVNNFNAVKFQVRGMSDAMYESSFEPWSAYISGTRGVNPGWDPLAFTVEECHKRGLECYAWINPYRFNTSGESGAGDPTGYYENGWLLTTPSGYRILNPGKEAVQNRIVDICEEIITKYDVDGMLFDDYFYCSTAMSEDKADYNAYTAAGGTMTQADWRRNNVLTLMTKLYDMIGKSAHPWVRFGQAPGGGTATESWLAAKYGVDPCPSGYENNYYSHYIDILGWLNAGVIDFISPQIYWSIGYSKADYGKMVPWWGTVANKFNRHLFVSQTIQYLNGSEGTEAQRTFSEYVDQANLNRSSSLNGSSGSVYYSQKYLNKVNNGITFAHYLKRNVYQYPALLPAMTWKSIANPGKVSGIKNTDGTLSWTGFSDKKFARYTVYAIPNSIDPSAFSKEVKYLLGVTYTESFELPEQKRSGHYYAVCCYDRYGNEWEPEFLRSTYATTLSAPVLVSPANGTETVADVYFAWNAVEGAAAYYVDMAYDSNFADFVLVKEVAGTKLSSADVYSSIPKNKQLYWRVRAVAEGKNDGISEVRTFNYRKIAVTSPENDATEVDPCPVITWDNPVASDESTLEIAADEAFTDIVYTYTGVASSHTVPAFTLHGAKSYYVRVSASGITSDAVVFKVKELVPEVPVVISPTNGGVLLSNWRVHLEPQQAAYSLYVDIATTTTFGSNTCSLIINPFTGVSDDVAADFKFGRFGKFSEGTIYYLRARALYYDAGGSVKWTDYTDNIQFTYSAASGINGVAAVHNVSLAHGANARVIVNAASEVNIKVTAVSMTGAECVLHEGLGMNEEVSLTGLDKGIYVIKVQTGDAVRTLKFVR